MRIHGRPSNRSARAPPGPVVDPPAIGWPPTKFPAPATEAAETIVCFVLPVSTPCNAIVYGSGRIPLPFMLRQGIVLDVIGVVAIVAVVWLLGPLALGGTR